MQSFYRFDLKSGGDREDCTRPVFFRNGTKRAPLSKDENDQFEKKHSDRVIDKQP
jgi:hypothetical protein